ncbi:MAG: hypothetical protein WBG85_05225, partial [Rhodanobacter sp.]
AAMPAAASRAAGPSRAIAVLRHRSYLLHIRAAAYPGDRRSYRGKKRGYLSTLSERPWIPDIHFRRAGARVVPSGQPTSPSLRSSSCLPSVHGF